MKHIAVQTQKPERPNATKQIGLLAAEVESATAVLGDTKTKAAKAQADEVAARSRVNKAQRELDSAMEQLRKAAPFDSDWARSKS